MIAAVMCVALVAFLFVYPREADDLSTETEAPTLPKEKISSESPSEAQSSESPAEAREDAGSSASEWPDTRASEEQLSTQRRAHTPEELSCYIDRTGASYRNAQRYLSQADVPTLVAMLDDPLQSQNWWKIESSLGYIDEGGVSADALIAFIFRADDWERLQGRPRPGAAMLSKADAISKLGFIGGDAATDALRLLFTEEGAIQYLSEWSDDAIAASSVSKYLVRSKAAQGLVYTQEAANIQLVEQFYQSVLPQVRAINRRPGEGNILNKSETKEDYELCKLYTLALTALAYRDYIESEGIEEWKSIVNDTDMRQSVVIRYFGKYSMDLEE